MLRGREDLGAEWKRDLANWPKKTLFIQRGSGRGVGGGAVGLRTAMSVRPEGEGRF